VRNDLRVLDADGHVVEAREVFAEFAPPGAPPWDLPSTTPAHPGGDPEALQDVLKHGFDAPSYLRAMDLQDIDAAVLYPSMGLFVPYMPELDADTSAAACRSYNDWIAGFCATDASRLAAVGIVPRDPKAAAEEAGRCAELDLVGVTVRPNHFGGAYLHDKSWDTLYHALEETGGVLAIHEALGVRQGITIGSDRFTNFGARHICSHPLEMMNAAVAMLLEGVCEQHPNLRVAFLESGTGWLPYWLARLDDHDEWMHETETASLSLKPSEYFARQCAISSDPEDVLIDFAIESVGSDHVFWASDFPHPDAEFPGAVDEFLEKAEKVAESDLRAVLWDTPVRFYGLEDRFAA